MSISQINRALARCTKRAETMDPDQLVGTFVQDGALFARLDSRDHQILYGRRGTGKTHALKYLTKTKLREGKVAVYIDLQTIGSTGGLYADPDLPIAEASTCLLVDTITAIHDQLRDDSFSESGGHGSGQTLPLLEELSDNITEIQVRGREEWTLRSSEECDAETSAGLGAHLSGLGPLVGGGIRSKNAHNSMNETALKVRGAARHHVYFGSVHKTMKKLVATLPSKQLWIMLDEWTDVPMYLQPLLADLIRRSLFPVPGLSVKIGAIEQRSQFWAERDTGGYIGIELGGDAAADMDLDDLMVFGNNQQQAMAFFARLLSQHASIFMPREARWSSPEEFLDAAFVHRDAFGELVRAAEGVPRDAINIVSLAATRAGENKIARADIREAARSWYLRDKEKPVTEKDEARQLLHWIVDRVIGERQCRAFLLEQGSRHQLVDWLYDARVLHVIKKGMASKSHPGVRFDAYGLDYGCYIDLFSTQRAPRGLFETTDATFIEVPPDDVDTIRGAILNLQDFIDEQRHITSPILPIQWIPKSEGNGHSSAPSPPAPGRWLYFDGEGHVIYLALDAGRFVMGSERNCDIRIHHKSVEARQLVMTVGDDDLKITTNNSSYRTYVNNGRVVTATLADGDELRLGDVVLKVLVAPPA
ncbi:MAG: FHA domain-containing protein [Solirubrobacteraceae bacterium]